jgi:exonuclease SbcC
VEASPAIADDVAAELESARAALVDVEGELEARRTEWVRDRQEAETKRQALRAQYTELRGQRDRMVGLGDEGNCPTCMRPLRESYRSVLELLDNQLETVVVDGNYYKARMEQLESMPDEVRLLDDRRRVAFEAVANLERRLANAQNAVREKKQIADELASKEERLGRQRVEADSIPAGYDAGRHREVRETVERLAPLESRAALLESLLARLPRIAGEHERISAQLLDVVRRIADLRMRRDTSGFLEKDYVALRTAHEFAASQLHQAEVAAAAAQSDASGAAARLQAAQREREELARAEQRLGRLHMQRRMHEELHRAFSDLRTDLNFQLRPEISELASSFLGDLTEGRYNEFELDDAYRIVVLQDGVPKPVISGGEEDLANLSLRLAISQMIAERSGQSFSLLVLDEIFGSLDEEHRRSVVELLRRVRDRFEQVILITHIDSVREGLDRVISVTYDEESGAAVVEQVDTTPVARDRYDSTPLPGYPGGEVAAQGARGDEVMA